MIRRVVPLEVEEVVEKEEMEEEEEVVVVEEEEMKLQEVQKVAEEEEEEEQVREVAVGETFEFFLFNPNSKSVPLRNTSEQRLRITDFNISTK